MKPIVQKILKSGLVDKHTALLMEKWGTLDRGASEMVGEEDLRKVSEDALLEFIEAVDTLVEEERNIHETKFSIKVGAPFLIQPPPGKFPVKVVVFFDEMNNFIFPKDAQWEWFQVGNRFIQTLGNQVWQIEDITPLYLGEHRYAHQVKATKV